MARIFISYRREDSSAYAGRIYDRLIQTFGAANVFMDIDTLEPGTDFAEELQRTVTSCDVLLAILGKQWLGAKDEEGRARISNPDDLVALEIGAALERPNIRVVPILVAGATMPRSTEIPGQLSGLTRRQALVLPDIGFHQALGRLIQAIERTEPNGNGVTGAETRLFRWDLRTAGATVAAGIIACVLSYIAEVLTENVTYIVDSTRRWETICIVGMVFYAVAGFLMRRWTHAPRIGIACVIGWLAGWIISVHGQPADILLGLAPWLTFAIITFWGRVSRIKEGSVRA
jgi:hypothetical protein